MEDPFSLAAYRITQECLTNIAKHAGAGKVTLDANANGGFLELTIMTTESDCSPAQEPEAMGFWA